MALSLDQLQPAPTAQAPTQAPAEDAGHADRLQTVIAALQLGDPGAIYMSKDQFGGKYDEAKPRIDAALPKLGLASTETANGFVVYYNPKVISTEQIAQADKAGNLDSVATSFLPDQAAPEAAPAAAPDIVGGLTGSQPAAAPAPGAAPLAAERAANVNTAAPVKRALPSRGILDDLAKRAV